MLADTRLSRAMARGASNTAMRLFDEALKQKKRYVPLDQFARNFIEEALKYKNSFIYNETDGYLTGYLGYTRPITNTLFGNTEIFESFDSILDGDHGYFGKSDPEKFEAFTRLLLTAMESKVKMNFWAHSFVLTRAIERVERSVSALRFQAENAYEPNSDTELLNVAISFLRSALEILDEHGPKSGLRIKTPRNFGPSWNLIDQLSKMYLGIIFDSSRAREPEDYSWYVQHNVVWSNIFEAFGADGYASSVFKAKVRRRLFDDIKTIERHPNYKNTRILGFCLHVMGLSVSNQNYTRDYRALHRTLLSWTTKNFLDAYSKNPKVVDGVAMGSISIDLANNRLVKTLASNAFRVEPDYRYLSLEKPQTKQ